MAMKILEDCIACGACEPECPNEAIHSGESIYSVDAQRCTECVGAYESQRCLEVCPIDDCIVVDPALAESRETLRARYELLHA